MKWARRIVVVLAVLSLFGAVWEQVAQARDFERYRAPGKLYDVGDHQLHLVCVGDGSPTIVLEASGVGNASTYEPLQALLAKRTRVCAYDRAGMGFSERNPRALSSAELADDLEKLLTAAKLPPPYVLAGASVGGLTVEMFARRHPDTTQALVFIDAVDSQSLEEVGSEVAAMRFEACAAAWLGRVGVLRLIDPFHLTGAAAALTYRSAPFDAACSVLRHLAQSDRELAQVAPLKSDLPLLVLSHEVPKDLLPQGEQSRAFEPAWLRLQRAQAARSTRGEQWTVAQSGHLVAQDRPGAVAQAMFDLLDRTAAP